AQYAEWFTGEEECRQLEVRRGETSAWAAASTYVKNPPYFAGMTMEPPGIRPIAGARALAMLGDSITPDHISPAGNIPASSPAGTWLVPHRGEEKGFKSDRARRGHPAGVMRGTFANICLPNIKA